MRWQNFSRSRNIEDRRGRGRSVVVGGTGLGCGGILLVLVISWLTGTDPAALLDMVAGTSAEVGGGGGVAAPDQPQSGQPDELSDFASAILGDLEQTWGRVFEQMGRQYRPPTLVLFDDSVQSACGLSSAAVGPFYCPADQKLYLDFSFFRVLSQRLGAPGDFAQAYVIAHEVGHHVQNLLGISGQVTSLQQRMSQGRANQLSVRLELQADCLAGVWGHYAGQHGGLEPGDIEEGLRAAAAIGDDTLQRNARGRVAPETFTHGSSEQRVDWLRRGLTSGDPGACQTFDQ